MSRAARTLVAWLLVWTLSCWPALAATRYWVGGTGTYDSSSTTHWSASSGGAGGASAPNFLDSVIFDANSGGGTVTVNNSTTGIQIGNLDMSAAAAMTLAGVSGSGNMSILNGGTVVLGSSVTYSTTATLSSNGTASLTFNGVTWGGALQVTGGTLTLGDALSVTAALTVSGGTLAANNKNLTMSASFTLNGTGAITMGSGTWAVNGSSGTVWTVTGSVTVTPGTSTIKLNGNAVTFAGGGKTYNNLWVAHGANTGTVTLTGANTFADLKDDGTAAHALTLPASTTTTASTIHIGGAAGNVLTLNSSSSGTRATLSVPSGSVTPDYISIKDSAATGGATFTAGANSTDAGNNTGWTFPNTLQPFFSMIPPP